MTADAAIHNGEASSPNEPPIAAGLDVSVTDDYLWSLLLPRFASMWKYLGGEEQASPNRLLWMQALLHGATLFATEGQTPSTTALALKTVESTSVNPPRHVTIAKWILFSVLLPVVTARTFTENISTAVPRADDTIAPGIRAAATDAAAPNAGLQVAEEAPNILREQDSRPPIAPANDNISGFASDELETIKVFGPREKKGRFEGMKVILLEGRDTVRYYNSNRDVLFDAAARSQNRTGRNPLWCGSCLNGCLKEEPKACSNHSLDEPEQGD